MSSRFFRVFFSFCGGSDTASSSGDWQLSPPYDSEICFRNGMRDAKRSVRARGVRSFTTTSSPHGSDSGERSKGDSGAAAPQLLATLTSLGADPRGTVDGDGLRQLGARRRRGGGGGDGGVARGGAMRVVWRREEEVAG